MLIMLGVTALTAVNTFNGGFVTLSRFVYAVAREGKLPRALTRLNECAVPVVPVWILGISSLVLAVVVSVTGSWVMVVSLCAALEMMIYAAAYVVWRLRRREAGTQRPFRLVAGRFLALAFAVVFGALALISSVTVGKTTSAAPLVLLAVIAGLVPLYVLTYVPQAGTARGGGTRRPTGRGSFSWACFRTSPRNACGSLVSPNHRPPAGLSSTVDSQLTLDSAVGAA